MWLLGNIDILLCNSIFLCKYLLNPIEMFTSNMVCLCFLTNYYDNENLVFKAVIPHRLAMSDVHPQTSLRDHGVFDQCFLKKFESIFSSGE